MKCITLLVLLAGTVLTGSSLFLSDVALAGEPNDFDLDSRDVVVRIYRDWRKRPEDFEKETLKLKGRKLVLDIDDADRKCIFALVGSDQNDATIAQSLGNAVYADFYRPGLEYTFSSEKSETLQTKSWNFKDVLGNPISGAMVEVYIEGDFYRQERVLIEVLELDETSRTEALKALCFDFQRFYFVISHKDYGIGAVRLYCATIYKNNEICAPMAPVGSRAEMRCAWGKVVDDSNRPISGAVVKSYNRISLPGGSAARVTRYRDYHAITDEYGRFWLYPAIDKDAEELRGLIPEGSKCPVTVEPPGDFKLLPFRGNIPMGRECSIKLERGWFFHTFVFKDENGKIIDNRQLDAINLYISRPGKETIILACDDIGDGEWLPPGKYSLNAAGRKKNLRFEVKNVTANSPELLVFKAVSAKICCGQVVEAESGEPIEGAFVIAERAHLQGASLASLMEYQWEQLHKLPLEPNENSPALEPVKKMYEFAKIVRTDSDGYFEVLIPASARYHSFVIFQKDYLTVKLYNICPGHRFDVEPPIVKLFPAAKVSFVPAKRTVKNRCVSFSFDWMLEPKKLSTSPEHTLRPCGGDCALTDKNLHISYGKLHSCYVPALENLRIYIDPSSNKWGTFVYPPDGTVTLAKGQELNLGRIELSASVKIFAKVQDSSGATVESVPVALRYSDGRRISPHITDINGVAEFSVDPNSSGEFVVEHKQNGDDSLQLRDAVPYEIKSLDDANNVYTLQLSDKIMECLFKER